MNVRGSAAKIAVVAVLLAVCCSDSHAQGSTGGTIGKIDKSLSGSLSTEPQQAAPKSKSTTRESGGNVRAFDGSWTFVATGCGAGSKPGVISGGRVRIGDGGGSVSASGAMRVSFTTLSGVTQVAVGRLSGSTGSGTYSRPNGCSGSWTASKQ